VHDSRAADGALTAAEIAAEVAAGAEVPFQLDLTRFEDDFSLDDQESVVGELALFGLTALFEGALEEACKAQTFSHKKLMFAPDPDVWSDVSRINELGPGWKELRTGGSTVIDSAFGDRYRSNPHYSIDRLPHLEVAFRYWKEVRNCLIHAGGHANQNFLTAQAEYLPTKRTDTGLRRKIMISKSGDVAGNPAPAELIELGDPLDVTAYGSFNAAEVMLKLATTLDFLIARTPEGEEDVIARLNAGVNEKRWLDPQYRHRRLVRALTTKANLPSTATPDILFDALVAFRANP
jgi:hypothetical protein